MLLNIFGMILLTPLIWIVMTVLWKHIFNLMTPKTNEDYEYAAVMGTITTLAILGIVLINFQ